MFYAGYTHNILQNIKMGKDYLGADQRKTTDKKDTEEKEIKVQSLSYLNVKQIYSCKYIKRDSILSVMFSSLCQLLNAYITQTM